MIVLPLWNTKEVINMLKLLFSIKWARTENSAKKWPTYFWYYTLPFRNLKGSFKKNIYNNIVKYFLQFKITVSVLIYLIYIYIYLFLWCKAEFSASLLQSSVSHDPSEIILIWFAAQETFLIFVNVENMCCFIYLWLLAYRILWWIESSKEQHLFEI